MFVGVQTNCLLVDIDDFVFDLDGWNLESAIAIDCFFAKGSQVLLVGVAEVVGSVEEGTLKHVLQLIRLLAQARSSQIYLNLSPPSPSSILWIRR